MKATILWWLIVWWLIAVTTFPIFIVGAVWRSVIVYFEAGSDWMIDHSAKVRK